jgi:hypothetical protein
MRDSLTPTPTTQTHTQTFNTNTTTTCTHAHKYTQTRTWISTEKPRSQGNGASSANGRRLEPLSQSGHHTYSHSPPHTSTGTIINAAGRDIGGLGNAGTGGSSQNILQAAASPPQSRHHHRGGGSSQMSRDRGGGKASGVQWENGAAQSNVMSHLQTVQPGMHPVAARAVEAATRKPAALSSKWKIKAGRSPQCIGPPCGLAPTVGTRADVNALRCGACLRLMETKYQETLQKLEITHEEDIKVLFATSAKVRCP